ncbi:lytic transglycosylase domain-containing protein [Brevundimonas aveniformis]|uniref:lytic transglycosylase domain-containing protein n=1 Tax=Brevundimonas aveniformis TaxID=370977 RepID=UPI0004049308|nr:lytic transglycosylase domain-containing protein [Brevundimonas aveniformis]
MRLLSGILAAFVGLALFASNAIAEPRPLNEADEASYRSAFQDVRRGEFASALDRASHLSDRLLLGQLQFEILFHRDYAASFGELSAWLTEYADLADAPRVYTLAMRRIPPGEAEPRLPPGLAASRAYQASVGMGEFREREARHQLNDGFIQRAWEVGQIQGDYWVAGMAAYRLGRYADAFEAFERVAIDPSESGWIRAGAGYWAARSLTQDRRPQQATDYLRLAARWPTTFYGQIAMRQLGAEPLILNAPWITPGPNTVVYGAPEVDEAAAAAFVSSNPAARRVAALAQIGRTEDAIEELRLGTFNAATSDERLQWAILGESLAYRLGLERTSQIDAADYPMPDLQPQGGFSLPRGLVYAIARKESRFNPQARSGAGAYGIMQVMPATAAELSANVAFRREPTLLFDPAINMRLGQAYVERVMAMDAIQGDLLRAIVAYNGGPRPVIEARRALGADADSLLIIENIPVSQSRQYVEEVVAAYWVYQRLLGGRMDTLDAAAQGMPVIHVALDRDPEPPPPVTTDAASEQTASPATQPTEPQASGPATETPTR